MLKIIRNWWWARQRAMDIKILWPACYESARDIDHAMALFMGHAANDPAWAKYYGNNLPTVIEQLFKE